eukprot:6865841-Prymnesium_polylepis.2
MLRRLGSFARTVGERYASTSDRYPHAVAGSTACGIMSVADVSCQAVLQHDSNGSFDWQRTVSLAVFGAWHYGVPGKYLYLWYDRRFGTAPSFRSVLLKTGVDVYGHGMFLLVPSFYVITGTIKGQPLSDISAQYQREWFTASFGTALYWTPLCLLNFRFVPQHSRILVVSVLSLIHKTWMSWLSNRERHAARLLWE